MICEWQSSFAWGEDMQFNLRLQSTWPKFHSGYKGAVSRKSIFCLLHTTYPNTRLPNKSHRCRQVMFDKWNSLLTCSLHFLFLTETFGMRFFLQLRWAQNNSSRINACEVERYNTNTCSESNMGNMRWHARYPHVAHGLLIASCHMKEALSEPDIILSYISQLWRKI